MTTNPISNKYIADFEPFPIYNAQPNGAPCCGPPPAPASSPHERPGYRLEPFVEEFISTAVGAVPRVGTTLSRRDHLGSIRVRSGIGRENYKIAPGVYAVGSPDAAAPVVVSANYKLSFDHLRGAMAGLDAWILVLDTRGINVWCAAGKGTFGTEEIIKRVRRTRLDELVVHRRLVLPQLAAVGVAAHHVKKGCGFEVVYGPIRASDLRAFLAADMQADESMRRVTFQLTERLVLIPVELSLLRHCLHWALVAMFLLSGVGRSIFSFSDAWHRGLLAGAGCLAGVLAGCVVVPALLNQLPGRAFSVKGAFAGLIIGVVTAVGLSVSPHLTFWRALAMILMTVTIASFLAMNFTGATPFTSASGVEKEMRRAIPVQLAGGLLSVILWVGAAFAK